jgi:nitrogen fixation protein FixH
VILMTTETSQAKFTGKHLIAVMVAFFGVIISVNVFMAVKANTTWSGLVVKNSYVAGLSFTEKSEEARAQDALGWTAALDIADGELRYGLSDRDGTAIALSGGQVTFWRPTSDREDATMDLAPRDGAAVTPVELGDGAWIVAVSVDAGLDHAYRDTRRIRIREGKLQ